MATSIKKNNFTYFRCASCGFAYTDKKTAQQCEAWCKQHHSCNLEITKKAVKIE